MILRCKIFSTVQLAAQFGLYADRLQYHRHLVGDNKIGRILPAVYFFAAELPQPRVAVFAAGGDALIR